MQETVGCRVLSVFVGEGGREGGRWGFQLPVSLEDMAGGSEGREFSVLTAWCTKLFLSLAVRQRRLLYLLPEGRRLNSQCAGWLVSLAIEGAFWVRRVVYVSSREGSGAPMIFPAVFTLHCSAFLLYSVQLPPHTMMQLDRMLSMVPR